MDSASTPTPATPSVLVDHWPTILWRSSANWAAWITVVLPDILAWALSHLDVVPSDLLSDTNKNLARIVLVSVAVPLARVWKQHALQRALDRKDALAPSVPLPL